MKRTVIIAGMVLMSAAAGAQETDSALAGRIFTAALTEGRCYQDLRSLCKDIGHRLSGSSQAEAAVKWAAGLMKSYGFDTVWLQEVMVPKWVRGEKEYARIEIPGGRKMSGIPILALGGSVGTGSKGITAGVVEVRSFEALDQLDVKGKIVFFNRPMDPSHYNTFEAYGGAVRQRSAGAVEAAKRGAVGVIVRSMCLRQDDFPHTGAMHYEENVTRIPAAAISTNGADLLSELLAQHPGLKFHFRMSCFTAEDVLSYNVIGEIKGSAFPEEIIVVGGHLDSWDVGEGAHDDGAGCVQAIEALRLIKTVGIKPERTVRAVMFMNEENGLRGAKEYAGRAKENNEKHIAAIESDAGGFTPVSFGTRGTPEQVKRISDWEHLFSGFGMHGFGPGWGGADISQLESHGTALIGLRPDSQRYFDYHHAATDVFEAVSRRELELGSAALAALIVLISKYGL